MVNKYANTLAASYVYTAKIMAFYCSVVGTFNTLCYWTWDINSLTTALITFNAFAFYLIYFGGMFEITDLAKDLFDTLFQAARRAGIVYLQANYPHPNSALVHY